MKSSSSQAPGSDSDEAVSQSGYADVDFGKLVDSGDDLRVNMGSVVDLMNRD